MTLARYHAHPAISRSKLWWAHDSPAKFKFFCENPPPQTPEMLIGAAWHKMVLEPETFLTEYVPMPAGIGKNTIQGRAIADAAREAGKNSLASADYDLICGMTQSILANRTARYFIDEGAKEQSIFWTDEETGEAVKCRPDIFIANDDMHIICDLKSCASAETDDFTRACINYGYAMQAAMYIEGVQTVAPGEYSFLFFAVEKKPPFSVNILQMDQAMIDYGRIQYHELLETVHKCKETGNWYGMNGENNTINKILLPAWVH